MAVLYIRDGNRNFVPIPALRGKSAYDQAKEGGYQGTEEDFIAWLNNFLLNPVSAVEVDTSHFDDKNNPHEVTAKQTGAIPEAYYTSKDLNTELQEGGNKVTICNYGATTLNSPYKEGLTTFPLGLVITNAYSKVCSTQICIPTGDVCVFARRLNGNGISNWEQIAGNKETIITSPNGDKFRLSVDDDGVLTTELVEVG